MTQEIDIPDLPDGYTAIKYAKVKYDANTPKYVFDKGAVRLITSSDDGQYLLRVKTIAPKRLVLEQTNEVRKIEKGEWLEDSDGNVMQWTLADPSSTRFRFWRVVEE